MYTIIGLLVLLLIVINLPDKKKTKKRSKPKMTWSEYFRNGKWYHEIEV